MRASRLISLPAALLVACAAGALSPASGGAVTKSCGSAQSPKPSGSHWVCTFGDNFKGRTLRAANWQTMSTASEGFTQAGECYVNDRSHIAVGHGVLKLTATKLSSPRLCGTMISRYESGMIFTKSRFAQAYGRFKVRAKMPRGVGFQSAFWMWPQSMDYGDRSGEIDIAEAYGAYPGLVSPHIHMIDALGIRQSPGADCRVAHPSGKFHTYTVVWLPTGMRFKYDGRTCWNLPTWNPGAPLVAPQPFDKPFFMLLQLALGYGDNAPTDASPFPARFVIDYVRAWRYESRSGARHG